jgi:hypothetical protein
MRKEPKNENENDVLSKAPSPSSTFLSFPFRCRSKAKPVQEASYEPTSLRSLRSEARIAIFSSTNNNKELMKQTENGTILELGFASSPLA